MNTPSTNRTLIFRTRRLFEANANFLALALNHLGIDIFRDNTGRSDALDACGLDIRVDFVHHGCDR